MPAEKLIVKVIAESVYRCKNRIAKSDIHMTTLKIIIGSRLSFCYDITCNTHNQVSPIVKNKTEAIFAVRKPWLWCDGCAQIHFNTVWQDQLIQKETN